MNRLLLASALLATLTSAVQAQDVPAFDGIFASSEAGCEAVAAGGDLISPDFTIFEPTKGISTMDFHCDFVDIKQNGTSGWYVATAFCEEPGFQYPDMFTFTQNPGGDVMVTTLSGAVLAHSSVDSVSLADGTYLQCKAPSQ